MVLKLSRNDSETIVIMERGYKAFRFPRCRTQYTLAPPMGINTHKMRSLRCSIVAFLLFILVVYFILLRPPLI